MAGGLDSSCCVSAAVRPASPIPIGPAHEEPPGGDTRSPLAAAPIFAGAALGQDSWEHLDVPQEPYPLPHPGLSAFPSIRGVAWGANSNVMPVFRISAVLARGEASSPRPHGRAPTECCCSSTVRFRCNKSRRRCTRRVGRGFGREHARGGIRTNTSPLGPWLWSRVGAARGLLHGALNVAPRVCRFPYSLRKRHATHEATKAKTALGSTVFGPAIVTLVQQSRKDFSRETRVAKLSHWCHHSNGALLSSSRQCRVCGRSSIDATVAARSWWSSHKWWGHARDSTCSCRASRVIAPR
jgi:hypothetical protein